MRQAEKEKLVKALHEKFSKAKTVILTDFRGLNTPALNNLRNQLRESSLEYQVVKNTLLLRASEGTDMMLLKKHFSGPSAVAISYDDLVAPAKIVTKFSEENTALEIKAGIVDGKAIDLEGINRLAKLPSRDTLIAQLLSVLNGPLRSLVEVLKGVPRDFLSVLQAIKEKKEPE